MELRDTGRTVEDVQAMRKFILANSPTMATKGWSDEEKEKWPAVVEEAVRKRGRGTWRH